MSNLPSTSIQIDRPAPQTTSEVQVPPKAYLNFTFSLTGASSAKQGDDLIIELPDGSKVVCLGYYSNTAEGERPQIAVNGEPLPDTALDLGFTDSHVEGQRIEGALEGRDDQQGEGQTTEGQDGKDQTGDGPASSGATATGDSADGGLQNAANSGQNAGQSGSTGDSGNTGSSTGSSSGSSGASGMLNEGAFKQDMNVDFLGGIPRLPGLDLGSDRGFNTTDIEGSAPPPLSWDNNTGATPPPPAEAPVIPSAPLEPSVIFREVGGLKEAGFDADRNPVGQDSTSDRFTFTVPEGTDPADIVLDFSLFPGDPATGDTQYGNISYTVSIDRQVPVLGEDGTPLKDEDGNPVYRTEATVELKYSGLDNTHDDINGLPLGGTLREDVSFDVVIKGTTTNPDGTTTTTNTNVGSANVGFVIEGSNDAPPLAPAPNDPSGNVVVGHGEVKEEGVYSDNRNTSGGGWDKYDPATPGNPDDPAYDPAYGTHKNTTTVQLGVNDVDKGDSHTFTLTTGANSKPQVSVEGLHSGKNVELVDNGNGNFTLKIDGVDCGTLTLSPSGTLNFTLDSNSSVIQAMKAGDASTIKLNVTVTDRGGLSDTGDVTLTIHGTNDRPTLAITPDADEGITVDAAGNARVTLEESGKNTEADYNSITGTLTGKDVDAGETGDLEFYVAKDPGVAGKPSLDAANDLYPVAGDKTIIDGKYGTLELGKDGVFTYKENGELKGGEVKTETFTVLVKDPNGAFSTKEVTFEVKGKYNDITFAQNTESIQLVEDGVQDGGNTEFAGKILTVQGNIAKDGNGNSTITDPDGGDITFALKPGDGVTVTSNTTLGGVQTIVTDYGTVVFNTLTGEYTYTLNGAKADALGLNDSLKELFTVQIFKPGADGRPSEVNTDLTLEVNIQGTNDKPELQITTEGGVAVDPETGNGSVTLVEGASTPTTVTGKLGGTDVDNGDQDGLTYSIVKRDGDLTDKNCSGDTEGSQTGAYGTLVVNPDGTFTYKENGSLQPGMTGTDTFTVLVKDAHGAFSTKEIAFTVKGEYNDVHFNSPSQSIIVVEEGVNTGGNRPNTPVSTVSGNILESGGNPTFTDPDTNVVKSYTLSFKGGVGSTVNGIQTIDTDYGTITFNTATGAYTYTLKDQQDIDHLPLGGKLTEQFTVQVSKDGHSVGSNLTLDVEIQGTNDKPTLTVTTEGGVSLDGQGNGSVSLIESGKNADAEHTVATGRLTASDVDNGDTWSYFISKNPVTGDALNGATPGNLVTELKGTYGTLIINNATGTFTYKENGSLHVNQTGSDTFTVLVKDKNGAFDVKELTFNVTGAENKLEISGDNYVIMPVESGVLNGGNDPNNAPATITGNVAKTPDGKDFIIDDDSDASSMWTYTLKPKTEGTDKPNIISTTPNGDEITYVTANGTLVFNTKTGAYSYEINNAAVDHLRQGESLSERFTITVTKNGQTVTQDFVVNIQGTNDIPTITVDNATLTVTESLLPTDKPASSTATGTATGHDVDNTADELSYSVMSGSSRVQVMSGTYGILRIDPETGKYTYELDNTRDITQQLGRNDIGEEKFTIRVTDKFGAWSETEIIVKVQGTYDQPIVTYGPNTVLEDGGAVQPADGHSYSTSGTVNVSTVDSVHAASRGFAVVDASGTQLGTVNGNIQTIVTGYGTLKFNMTDGSYEYIMSAVTNAAMQDKNINDPYGTDSFTVRVTFRGDGNQTVDATLNIDLKGTNDAPEFFNTASFDTVNITRTHPTATGPTATNTATAEDVDNKDPQDSGANSELLFYFKLTMEDGRVEFVQSITTDYGSVTINATTGEYVYTLNNLHGSVLGLAAGATLPDHFTVWVRDPHGAEDSHDVNVTINGDTFTGTGDDSYKLDDLELVVKEDSSRPETDHPNDGNDPDPGLTDESNRGEHVTGVAIRYGFKNADGSVSLSMQGKYGTIYIDAYTGQYRYVLDNQSTIVQALAGGVPYLEKDFVVSTFTTDANGKITWVTDPQLPGGTIKVTVQGTNDDPTLEHSTPAGEIKIFGGAENVNTSGDFNAKDIDVGDKLTFSLGADGTAGGQITLPLTWGTVTIDAVTGEYTYTYAAGLTGSGKETFWVYVNDGHGGKASQQVTIDLSVANARPVVVSCTFEGLEGAEHSSYAFGSATPDLGVNTTTGDITLGGETLPQGATLTAGMLETTHNLKGSFASWDYEVDVAHQPGKSNFQYFLCDADGKGLTSLKMDEPFGALELNMENGSFTFTLNSKNEAVMALKEGETKTLTYHLVVRDADGLTSEVQDFNIVITGTNNAPTIAAQGAITMTENDQKTAEYTLTITDPDLDATKTHDFNVTVAQGDKNLTVTEAKSSPADGDLYSFTVMKDGSTKYGVFHIKMDPDDPLKAQYWFELNNDAVDYLGSTDSINLKFTITFDDGQKLNSLSNEASFELTIQGLADGTGRRSLSLTHNDVPDMGHDTAADSANAANPVEHAANPALPDAHAARGVDALAVDNAGTPLAEGALSPVEGSLPPAPTLHGPDYMLPGTAPLDSGMTAAGTTTGAEPPLTLETPLPDMPAQDMTSAPGQESLQFQLQTTGV